MNILRSCVAALPLLALGAPAFAATNLTGSYLITVTGHPAGVTGQTLCAVLVEDGSTLGFANSGTFTIVNTAGGTPVPGRWFTRNFAVTFEAPLSQDGFIVFSGVLGSAKITGSSFVQVINGQPDVGGTFTATKGCPTAS